MEPTDSVPAAELHSRCIPNSLNATLGTAHLTFLYGLITDRDDAAAFVAVDAHGKVVGVVTGIICRRQFLRSALTLRNVVAAAIRVLVQPRAWLLCAKSVGGKSPSHPHGCDAELTTIAVDSVVRGSGLGRELVLALETAFRRRGVATYWLETQKENTAARSFYRALGFREFSEGSQAVCLVKEIASSVPS